MKLWCSKVQRNIPTSRFYNIRRLYTHNFITKESVRRSLLYFFFLKKTFNEYFL
jgi:hypothetical protein